MRELRNIALRCEDAPMASALGNWINEHVACCGCESLLDKEAHGKMAPDVLQKILETQARNRELEMGRLAVKDAGITTDFDIGYAIGRHTQLWVIR